MAQQDKTDWYWNGVLAGAVNNLYCDLINVDVVHVPYITHNRNSSFFLQTRRAYVPNWQWTHNGYDYDKHRGRDVVDVKCVWDDECNEEGDNGTIYVMLANKSRTKIRIHLGPIKNGCVEYIDWQREKGREFKVNPCSSFKLFSTGYVKGNWMDGGAIREDTGTGTPDNSKYTGIQINKYTGGTMVGLFSDKNVEDGSQRFAAQGTSEEEVVKGFKPGQYILVYDSLNRDGDGFAGQVRMITGREGERLLVDSPWLGFETLEGEGDEVKGEGLAYRIFDEWGEVVGFADRNKIYVFSRTDPNVNGYTEVYNQLGLTRANIIGVAEALNKIFVLTDNGFIHYNNDTGGYNKFFINDDMYAGSDKTSVAAYRDLVLAFGNKHIAVGVPNTNDGFWTMYNQSASFGIRSRYSYAEYDGDLIFVSNDKRLLALGISNTASKYMLQHEDVGDMVNGKLSALIPGDDVYISNDGNDLRIFIQTKTTPYVKMSEKEADIDDRQENTLTRIIKFDKIFKVWTEDLVKGILLQGICEKVYFGESGLYDRERGGKDIRGDKNATSHDFKTIITAYLMENESDWVGGTNSWLANRPKLYNLSKLNRLITTLGPGVYTDNTIIRVTSYVKGIGNIFEFTVNGDGNRWLGLVSDKFYGHELDEQEQKYLDCLESSVDNSQKKYQPKCTGEKIGMVQQVTRQRPWCTNTDELLTYDRGICINDSIYELAPSMPLVTNLGESQQYSTQIKLELIGGGGDIITFGGRLGEMFVAPLFTDGPDGEYQLQPYVNCN